MSIETSARLDIPQTFYDRGQDRLNVKIRFERQPFLPGFEPDFINETHSNEEFMHNLQLVASLPDDAPYFYFFNYETIEPLEEEVDEESEPKFCKCGKEATEFFSCGNCGDGHACEEHFDEGRMWNHADHDCDYNECCKRRHRAETITFKELENSVPKTLVAQEVEVANDGKVRIWHVAARKCTQEEILSTIRLWAANYIVEDWPEDVEKDPYSDLSW